MSLYAVRILRYRRMALFSLLIATLAFIPGLVWLIMSYTSIPYMGMDELKEFLDIKELDTNNFEMYRANYVNLFKSLGYILVFYSVLSYITFFIVDHRLTHGYYKYHKFLSAFYMPFSFIFGGLFYYQLDDNDFIRCEKITRNNKSKWWSFKYIIDSNDYERVCAVEKYGKDVKY